MHRIWIWMDMLLSADGHLNRMSHRFLKFLHIFADPWDRPPLEKKTPCQRKAKHFHQQLAPRRKNIDHSNKTPLENLADRFVGCDHCCKRRLDSEPLATSGGPWVADFRAKKNKTLKIWERRGSFEARNSVKNMAMVRKNFLRRWWEWFWIGVCHFPKTLAIPEDRPLVLGNALTGAFLSILFDRPISVMCEASRFGSLAQPKLANSVAPKQNMGNKTINCQLSFQTNRWLMIFEASKRASISKNRKKKKQTFFQFRKYFKPLPVVVFSPFSFPKAQWSLRVGISGLVNSQGELLSLEKTGKGGAKR